ncbi:MAG: ATP-binding protein [Flavobacteriales bacterium]
MLKLKTQTKTTLLLLSAFLTIIILFSVFVYFSVINYSFSEFNRLLEIRAVTTAKAELDDRYSLGVVGLREELFMRLPNETDYIFSENKYPDIRALSDSLNLPLSFFEEIKKFGKSTFNAEGQFYYGINFTNNQGNHIVIASAENYFEKNQSVYLKRTLILAICLAFLFSLIIAMYFSKYIFKPLRRIIERIKEISSIKLHLRLDPEKKKDELRELAITFNNMLDRLETAFETQNNFISNASHELRTPLTAIIGEADVTLSKLRQPEEYIESLQIILDEAEKLDRKTKALLFLAQTGLGGKVQKFEKIRIDQLLYDVKETIERIDNKNKVYLDLSLLPENPAKLKVKGNEQLLHLAFTNIVSNSCKYSNHNQVDISIGASDNQVVIIIRDKGIGIPDSEIKYIYDPFFRASNTKNHEGYGIGLPLTRNIIRIHKGELLVSSIENKGTTVQINLPIEGFESDN